ncbi:unnamed protein product, partial [Laminaria digitata]
GVGTRRNPPVSASSLRAKLQQHQKQRQQQEQQRQQEQRQQQTQQMGASSASPVNNQRRASAGGAGVGSDESFESGLGGDEIRHTGGGMVSGSGSGELRVAVDDAAAANVLEPDTAHASPLGRSSLLAGGPNNNISGVSDSGRKGHRSTIGGSGIEARRLQAAVAAAAVDSAAAAVEDATAASKLPRRSSGIPRKTNALSRMAPPASRIGRGVTGIGGVRATG